MITMTTTHRPRPLGLAHAAATAAAVLVFLFVLFWAGAALGAFPVPHVPPFSVAVLAIGIFYALIVGALIGIVFAVFYNAFRFLGAVKNVERG